MFLGESNPPVYLYRGVIDMRIGVDRLSSKISAECGRSVVLGGLYVFFSKRRERVRVLYWDRDGYAVWTKRLEVGSFRMGRDTAEYEEMSTVELGELLSGIDYERIQFRKKAKKELYYSA